MKPHISDFKDWASGRVDEATSKYHRMDTGKDDDTKTTFNDILKQHQDWAEGVYRDLNKGVDCKTMSSLEKRVGQLHLAKVWIKDSGKKSSIGDAINDCIKSYLDAQK